MSWSIEEYLVYILDYFEDYSGFVIILAYDLRIDAYIDYRLGLVKDYKILEPGLLKITRKAKHEATENSESHIEYELERVVASDLRRAAETAAIAAAALGLAVEHDLRWRERDIGEWTGFTREEIEARVHTAINALNSGTR